MTAPRQEPSTKRDIVGLGWGERQLARRPALPSGCPCPLDTALAYDAVIDGTGTVPNNSLTTIAFDQVSLATGSTAFNVATPSPTTITPIEMKLDGWYLFYLNFEWSGGAYTDVRHYLLHFQFGADNDGNQDVSGNESAPYEASYHRTWGPLYFRATSLTPNISVKVWQNAGAGDQTITGVVLTAVYLGPDLDPARWPPF